MYLLAEKFSRLNGYWELQEAHSTEYVGNGLVDGNVRKQDKLDKLGGQDKLVLGSCLQRDAMKRKYEAQRSFEFTNLISRSSSTYGLSIANSTKEWSKNQAGRRSQKLAVSEPARKSITIKRRMYVKRRDIHYQTDTNEPFLVFNTIGNISNI
ncbi:unnamed protein product [Cylicocyclus nassatus]|uniref:Uncharacterized protein n=1 Tax=Cylicocyclus nassatus TaxID=53992 RepID=A0AA36M891_CYLNA|nr:unnamed protein product [Cylicocyclus nassatus]